MRRTSVLKGCGERGRNERRKEGGKTTNESTRKHARPVALCNARAATIRTIFGNRAIYFHPRRKQTLQRFLCRHAGQFLAATNRSFFKPHTLVHYVRPAECFTSNCESSTVAAKFENNSSNRARALLLRRASSAHIVNSDSRAATIGRADTVGLS